MKNILIMDNKSQGGNKIIVHKIDRHEYETHILQFMV